MQLPNAYNPDNDIIPLLFYSYHRKNNIPPSNTKRDHPHPTTSLQTIKFNSHRSAPQKVWQTLKKFDAPSIKELFNFELYRWPLKNPIHSFLVQYLSYQ